MSNDRNTIIKENLAEKLQELFDNDDYFRGVVQEGVEESLDIYDHDDVDFLDEKAGDRLEELAEEMFEGCDGGTPQTYEDVKELAYELMGIEDEADYEIVAEIAEMEARGE